MCLFIAYLPFVLSIYFLLLPGEIPITLKLALEFMRKHNYLFLTDKLAAVVMVSLKYNFFGQSQSTVHNYLRLLEVFPFSYNSLKDFWG